MTQRPAQGSLEFNETATRLGWGLSDEAQGLTLLGLRPDDSRSAHTESFLELGTGSPVRALEIRQPVLRNSRPRRGKNLDLGAATCALRP
jgi:hypothetical protein